MAEERSAQLLARSRRQALRRALHSRRALRQAFIIGEVLDPPVALRDPHRDRFSA